MITYLQTLSKPIVNGILTTPDATLTIHNKKIVGASYAVPKYIPISHLQNLLDVYYYKTHLNLTFAFRAAELEQDYNNLNNLRIAPHPFVKNTRPKDFAIPIDELILVYYNIDKNLKIYKHNNTFIFQKDKYYIINKNDAQRIIRTELI
jgi:hypothetical protein